MPHYKSASDEGPKFGRRDDWTPDLTFWLTVRSNQCLLRAVGRGTPGPKQIASECILFIPTYLEHHYSCRLQQFCRRQLSRAVSLNRRALLRQQQCFCQRPTVTVTRQYRNHTIQKFEHFLCLKFEQHEF